MVRRGVWTAWGVVLGLSTGAWAASSGKYTADSLKTVGGRGAAMGDAQTAAVEGADAVFWNPAGLAPMTRSEVTFMHNRSFQKVDQDVAHVAFPSEEGTVGLGFSSLRLAGIPGYDDNGNRRADLVAADTLGSLSWGRTWKDLPLLPGLQTGSSLRVFQKTLGENSASTVLADFGLLYETRGGVFRGLKTGLVVQNLGKPLTLLSQSSRLPVTSKLGWAWTFPGGLTAAMDAAFLAGEGDGPQVHAGFEYRPQSVVAFRFGGVTNHQSLSSGVTFGLGLVSGPWRLDYAFLPSGELGDAHLLSVGVRFGEALASDAGGTGVAGGDAPAAALYDDGMGLYKAKEYERALEDFEKVLALDPSHVEAKRRAALCRERIAKQAYKEGRAGADAGNWPDAAALFEKAVKMNPDLINARLDLESIRAKLKEQRKAESVELYRQGMDAYVSKDTDKALALWRKALEADPDNLGAKKGVDQILLDRQPPPAPKPLAQPQVKRKPQRKKTQAAHSPAKKPKSSWSPADLFGGKKDVKR